MNKLHLIGYRKFICSFTNFFSLQLNEFLQSEIKQKLSAVQKLTYIAAIADKRITSAFCYVGYCAPLLSLLFQLNSFLS